jgi:hypothetical protein
MNLFTPLREGTTPPVAVEIAAGRVTAATLERRGGQPVVSQHATELLPDGALVPSLTAANTHDRAAVMTALNRALEKVGRPRRIGLVVPDAIAKVSLVRFERAKVGKPRGVGEKNARRQSAPTPLAHFRRTARRSRPSANCSPASRGDVLHLRLSARSPWASRRWLRCRSLACACVTAHDSTWLAQPGSDLWRTYLRTVY